MRAAILAACAALAGCAGEPVPYHSQNEISRGPGLFTGPQGEFVLSSEDYRAYQEWRRTRETEAK